MKIIAILLNSLLLLVALYLIVDESGYGFDLVTWLMIGIFFSTPIVNLYALYIQNDDLRKVIMQRKIKEELKRIEELSK
jgi:hypothetical protein